ncbi:MAG TPA: aspartyl protease family protein [Chthoniobacteraceae bacterium]|jgi:hypothetical protein
MIFRLSALGAILLLTLAGCVSPDRRAGSNRIAVPDGKIDGAPVNIALDTGAGGNVIFRPAAFRIGLRVRSVKPMANVPDGRVAYTGLARCELTAFGKRKETLFYVIDTPKSVPPDVEAVVGWPEVRDKVFSLDAEARKIRFLRRAPASSAWVRLPYDPNSEILTVYWPGSAKFLGLDTGYEGGAMLDTPTWQRWRSTHSSAQTTVRGAFWPGIGLVANEEAWADALSLGPLQLTQSPISAAGKHQLLNPPPGLVASLGVAAIQRFDVIVDGEHHCLLLRPRVTPALPYHHNRAGVTFLPRSEHETALIAHVAPHTPASDAGIRDGDQLLAINGATDSVQHQWNLYGRSGEILILTLRRDGKIFRTELVLRNLLGPSA